MPLYINVYRLPDGRSHQPDMRHLNRLNAVSRAKQVARASAGLVTVAYRVRVTQKKPKTKAQEIAHRNYMRNQSRHLRLV